MATNRRGPGKPYSKTIDDGGLYCVSGVLDLGETVVLSCDISTNCLGLGGDRMLVHLASAIALRDALLEALPVEGWVGSILAPLHAKLNDHHEGAL